MRGRSMDGAARCQGKALSRGRGKMRSSGGRERPKACLRRAPCSRTLRRQRPRNCSRMQGRLADAFKMRRIAAARARKGNARAFDGRGGALSRESAVPGKGEDAQFGRAGTPEACLRRAPCSRTLRRQRPRNCSRMQGRLADAFKMRRIAAARARKES